MLDRQSIRYHRGLAPDAPQHQTPLAPESGPASERWSLPEAPECPPGWETGPPDFVGIGASRCGTTWWFGALRTHPSIATAPGRPKELHFFDRYWTQDVESDFAARYAHFFPRPPGSIAGEWTPGYMCDPWSLPLLAEAAPNARFLIMLRDPVERYRSEVAPVLRRLEETGYDAVNIMIANHALLHSMYHWQVKRALEIFGAARVLVLQYERCEKDPVAEMRRTQAFLGIEPLAGSSEALELRVPSGKKPPLPERLQAELSSLLMEDVRQLAGLCPELDPGLWPNFANA